MDLGPVAVESGGRKEQRRVLKSTIGAPKLIISCQSIIIIITAGGVCSRFGRLLRPHLSRCQIPDPIRIPKACRANTRPRLLPLALVFIFRPIEREAKRLIDRATDGNNYLAAKRRPSERAAPPVIISPGGGGGGGGGCGSDPIAGAALSPAA